MNYGKHYLEVNILCFEVTFSSNISFEVKNKVVILTDFNRGILKGCTTDVYEYKYSN